MNRVSAKDVMKNLHSLVDNGVNFALTLTALAAVAALSACGTQAAIDSANSIPPKLDKTNDNMVQMSGKLDKTNENTTSLSGKMDKTNSSMSEMSGKLDKTNDVTAALGGKMDVTNGAIHLQTLSIAWANMMAPNATKYIASPTDMMPNGKVFAETATAAEFMEFFHSVYMGIVTQTLSESDKDATTSQWPAQKISEIDHDKLTKLTALQVLSGFLPQDKVDQIVKEQINSGGANIADAYRMLALRYDFIYNMRLKNDLFADEGLTSPGMISLAVNLALELTAITGLPDLDKMQVAVQMVNPDDNPPEIKVAFSRTRIVWKQILAAFDKSLKPHFQQATDPATTKALADLKAVVLAHITPDPTASPGNGQP